MKRCKNCCFYRATGEEAGECKIFKMKFYAYNICSHYVSVEDKRHYTAVLLQHNRWRRDQHVPSIYKPVDATELGWAIDFAVEYLKHT